VAELTTYARPYAKAAFQYALDAKDLAGWSKQLATVAAASRYGVMHKKITTPSLSAQQQAQLLIDACGDELQSPVRNFIVLLAQNKRLLLLPEIYELFDAFKTAQEQAVDVELTTALPLDDANQAALAEALNSKLARKVNIQTVVDQHLLAGVIIKAGDLVIDGSMRGRLEKLAKAFNS
jgi:F-type H+-transporting ATPase subunit delta